MSCYMLHGHDQVRVLASHKLHATSYKLHAKLVDASGRFFHLAALLDDAGCAGEDGGHRLGADLGHLAEKS